MIVNFNNKTLHYYNYNDTIIIDRNDLCNLIDPEHAKSLTQKISMHLDRTTEQVKINKPDFSKVEGLSEEIVNQFVAILSFVTIDGLKKMLDKQPPFGKRNYDKDAEEWLYKIFINQTAPIEEPVKVQKEEQHAKEEIAAVSSDIKNTISVEDMHHLVNSKEKSIAEYVLCPDVIKAVRLKAINENKDEDDIVEEILRKSIDIKYFNLQHGC